MSDYTIGTNCQRGPDDTLGDMLNGLPGGIAFAVLPGIRMRRNNAANQQIHHIVGKSGSG
jgi:hypothetical protein